MKNKKKKIAIIGTAGVPSRYGGFETLAQNLVLKLNQKYDLHVYASRKIYARHERPEKWENAHVHYLPFNANGISSILYDIVSMMHAVRYADQLLVLGVSGGLFIPFVKWFTKVKVIVNIDGLEWRRDKWNPWVKRFLKFSEKVAVRYSDADITDNEAIKRYTAVYYKTASHLIAYGADHASNQTLNAKDYANYAFLARPYAFKVARVEPENNVHLILEAFAELPDKPLVVVGNWKNSAYGEGLVQKYKGFGHIHLLDPIYNQVELDKLRSNCFVYIHGHSAGGTNPSLVEAMFLGVPIIAFDVAYNRATMMNEGFYFHSKEDLKKCIIDTRFEAYKKAAKSLNKIATYKYTWDFIANRYASLFEAFEYSYVKPELVQKNTKMSYSLLLEKGYAHLEHQKMFFEVQPKSVQNDEV